MGTNYYLYEQEKCPHCGAEPDYKHIGKSSMGWCFSLHVDDEIKSRNNWSDHFYRPSTVIKDEYGERIEPIAMLRIIENREGSDRFEKCPQNYKSWEQFHELNNSEEGLNGLLRHQIDGSHCIGHGAGTYDYITGEFS